MPSERKTELEQAIERLDVKLSQLDQIPRPTKAQVNSLIILCQKVVVEFYKKKGNQ
ncbi:hypothetical protein CL65_gp069 [Mycobacterium phage Patience]|uniref:Uncharacterized protein n=1 Tax=Mycobacterium phage Patience TaxID=1074308 RepID=G1JWH9_9CAUD|nr:hypothetical protein CL65_gp069 [Mycobacterium phage Patience]AEL97977.1 hypothetical protein PATIENCE_68 [Mycobacterium phage Patience]